MRVRESAIALQRVRNLNDRFCFYSEWSPFLSHARPLIIMLSEFTTSSWWLIWFAREWIELDHDLSRLRRASHWFLKDLLTLLMAGADRTARVFRLRSAQLRFIEDSYDRALQIVEQLNLSILSSGVWRDNVITFVLHHENLVRSLILNLFYHDIELSYNTAVDARRAMMFFELNSESAWRRNDRNDSNVKW